MRKEKMKPFVQVVVGAGSVHVEPYVSVQAYDEHGQPEYKKGTFSIRGPLIRVLFTGPGVKAGKLNGMTEMRVVQQRARKRGK